jgi:hypothetical protein
MNPHIDQTRRHWLVLGGTVQEVVYPLAHFRQLPLGQDDEGRLYWLVHLDTPEDVRLYREVLPEELQKKCVLGRVGAVAVPCVV